MPSDRVADVRALSENRKALYLFDLSHFRIWLAMFRDSDSDIAMRKCEPASTSLENALEPNGLVGELRSDLLVEAARWHSEPVAPRSGRQFRALMSQSSSFLARQR